MARVVPILTALAENITNQLVEMQAIPPLIKFFRSNIENFAILAAKIFLNIGLTRVCSKRANGALTHSSQGKAEDVQCWCNSTTH